VRTRLTELVGVRHPIFQAPMAGATTPDLVAAVAGAGGLGMLAGTRLEPEELEDAIRAVRARTDAPFGVNFLLAPLEDGNRDLEAMQEFLDRYRLELGLPPGPRELPSRASSLPELVDVCLGERVAILSAALGDPEPLLAPAREIGARVFAMVTTVDEARRVAEAGVDVVVAQGAEAGGHRSTLDLGPYDEPPLVGTLALVPQVVDAVDVPVVAAGGIADGRGVAAALALGADAAQLGTRFLVSRESSAFPAWKRAVRDAAESDSVLTRAYTGRPARGVRNQLATDLASGPPALAWPLQAAAASDLYAGAAERDRADLAPLLAGQTSGLLRIDQPAAEIVAELVTGAQATLRRLGALLD
jgi:nitronate monooxygenase